MEKINVVLLDECDKDREKLSALLNEFDFVEIVGNTNSLNNAVDLINNLEPQLLFLGVKDDEANAFGILEKIKKQPTIIFSTDHPESLKTFEKANLRCLKKPYTLNDLKQLLNNFQQTHQQLATKMQGLLGKLKFDD